jgi:hypothetical protein
MTEHRQLPPRIPRAEAIWHNGDSTLIETRMYDIQQENVRVLEDIEACEREHQRLVERNHELVSEYEKLYVKLTGRHPEVE